MTGSVDEGVPVAGFGDDVPGGRIHGSGLDAGSRFGDRGLLRSLQDGKRVVISLRCIADHIVARAVAVPTVDRTPDVDDHGITVGNDTI